MGPARLPTARAPVARDGDDPRRPVRRECARRPGRAARAAGDRQLHRRGRGQLRLRPAARGAGHERSAGAGATGRRAALGRGLVVGFGGGAAAGRITAARRARGGGPLVGRCNGTGRAGVHGGQPALRRLPGGARVRLAGRGPPGSAAGRPGRTAELPGRPGRRERSGRSGGGRRSTRAPTGSAGGACSRSCARPTIRCAAPTSTRSGLARPSWTGRWTGWWPTAWSIRCLMAASRCPGARRCRAEWQARRRRFVCGLGCYDTRNRRQRDELSWTPGRWPGHEQHETRDPRRLDAVDPGFQCVPGGPGLAGLADRGGGAAAVLGAWAAR